MEILTSGSFINLENQDKIEQLKFTALELANAAINTEGFVNEEEPARKLAFEFWEGLEYLCRETEEAAVKNIFVGQFLTRLQELRVGKSTVGPVVPNETKEKVIEPIEVKTPVEDEFLGVVAGEESNQEEIPPPEISSLEVENFSIAETSFPAEMKSVEPDEISDDESPVETEEVETERIEASTETIPTETVSIANTQTEQQPATAAFSLPEKEPYQFNKCTVTIVVQLLPVEDNSIVRRAILSVKTHDFMPHISLVELSVNDLSTALAPEIEKVTAKYQSDLPVRVMDKLKKEKAQTKKPQTKPTSEPKTASPPPSAKNTPSDSSQSAATESNEAQMTNPTVAAATVPPKVETGLQGSLF